MENNQEVFRESSQAVQAHLEIIQSVIQRMAANSSSCKAWCITLVSAILVIVTDKGKPQYAPIAMIPTLLFLVLDTYYLALESMFRLSYNQFIDKLHSGKVLATDLYISLSLKSFSIWPFYLILLLMIYLVKQLVM
jgi:hypothetical protein